MAPWGEFWLVALVGIIVYVIIALVVIALFWACGFTCMCANRGVHGLIDDANTNDDAEPLIEKTYDVAP